MDKTHIVKFTSPVIYYTTTYVSGLSVEVSGVPETFKSFHFDVYCNGEFISSEYIWCATDQDFLALISAWNNDIHSKFIYAPTRI